MLAAFTLAARLLVVVPSDTPPPVVTPRPRPRAIEVSDWYHRRLVVHRWLAYTSLPAFGFQYAAGQQIWSKGPAAPAWARTGHRIGAATLGGIFTVNTVTGLWNLWDSRAVTEHRGLRYMHALSMLVADAGFTYAGAVLSEQAERDFEKRRQHRAVALTSIGISVTSGVLMKVLNK
jgi:hypothetical protein